MRLSNRVSIAFEADPQALVDRECHLAVGRCQLKQVDGPPAGRMLFRSRQRRIDLNQIECGRPVRFGVAPRFLCARCPPLRTGSGPRQSYGMLFAHGYDITTPDSCENSGIAVKAENVVPVEIAPFHSAGRPRGRRRRGGVPFAATRGRCRCIR